MTGSVFSHNDELDSGVCGITITTRGEAVEPKERGRGDPSRITNKKVSIVGTADSLYSGAARETGGHISRGIHCISLECPVQTHGLVPSTPE